MMYRCVGLSRSWRGTSTFLYNNGPVKSLNDATLLFRQHYTLQEVTRYGTKTLVRDAIAAPSDVGRRR
ncbi:MAG: hypothetical protein JWR24_1221 [Actinoallomurus sp.]|jgi:hypothetical protein|nr:hypothetical protein [Actinoallomurus sp.]